MAPSIKPKGPVMKIPRSGPCVASGEKNIGPKNPNENPIDPITMALQIIQDAKLVEIFLNCNQTYAAMPKAHNNDTTFET